MEVRGRRNRETTTTTTTSPERLKLYVQPKMKPFKKVQILYYLCRNGQLEHPHFMEVSHLAHQQLRLKDVIDRLIVLRGKTMPSLFSWSCKRSYKNGYVWNDLSEHDVIYPADGAEYVLKGSELIEGCAERFQQLQVVSNNKSQNPEPNFQPKSKLAQNRVMYMRGEEEEEEDDDEEEEEEEEEEKESNSARCSRGVSTDEDLKNPTEISLEDASPPSTSSTISEKTHGNNNNSERFEDGDGGGGGGGGGGGEPILMTRSSALFQLITCGSSVIMKERSNAAASSTMNKQYCLNTNGNGRKSSSLHRGVLCKSAINKMSDEDEINYMSENPRFGNPQSEEKEYFSGSIVDSMTDDRVATEPTLKKSSSYNEDRSNKSKLGDEPTTLILVPAAAVKTTKAATTADQAMKKSSSGSSSCIGMKGKCLPRKLKSNHSTTNTTKKSEE